LPLAASCLDFPFSKMKGVEGLKINKNVERLATLPCKYEVNPKYRKMSN